MGLMDKAKAAAEQAAVKAKAGAEQAAAKAREEMQELQTKRQLGEAYSELGKKAFDLAQAGTVTHGEFTPLVERIVSLQAQLAALAAPPAAPPPEAEAPAAGGSQFWKSGDS
jgi:hypothetical protein